MKKADCRFTLPVALAMMIAAAPIGATAQPFVSVQLPKGVTIELPRNWVVLSQNQRITLDSSTLSRLDLSGIEHNSSELPFAANCYDDRGNTIGIVNIRYYPDLNLTQDDARSLPSAEIKELDSALRENLARSMKAAGLLMTSWESTERIEVNQISAFVTEYHRRANRGGGDFRVRLVRVFAAEHSFTLTVSYLESASMLMQPIADRIIASLNLSGTAKPSSSLQKTKGGVAGLSAMAALFGEQWGLTVAFSFVATWSIGLAPPLVIRYVAVRRQIGQGGAIGIAGCFWILNVLLFTAVGGRTTGHGALALVAFASYAILRRPDSPKVVPVQH